MRRAPHVIAPAFALQVVNSAHLLSVSWHGCAQLPGPPPSQAWQRQAGAGAGGEAAVASSPTPRRTGAAGADGAELDWLARSLQVACWPRPLQVQGGWERGCEGEGGWCGGCRDCC